MSRDRNPDRIRIQSDLDEFLKRGGVIERLPTSGPGASSGRPFDDFNNRLWDGESREPRLRRQDLPAWGGHGD